MPMNFLMLYLINIPNFQVQNYQDQKKKKKKNFQNNIKCNLSSMVGLLVKAKKKKKKKTL